MEITATPAKKMVPKCRACLADEGHVLFELLRHLGIHGEISLHGCRPGSRGRRPFSRIEVSEVISTYIEFSIK